MSDIRLDIIERLLRRVDSSFSEGDHPRDEDGKFAAAAAASSAAHELTKKAVSSNGGIHHSRAEKAHQNAANLHHEIGQTEISKHHSAASMSHGSAKTLVNSKNPSLTHFQTAAMHGETAQKESKKAMEKLA